MEYENASAYIGLRKEEQLGKTRILREELGDKRTLDVGCGTGISSSLFSNVLGIDPSKTLLEENPSPYIKGRAEDLPFEDDSFENVIAVTSIHNFDDLKKGLEEMKRVGLRFGFSVLKSSKFFDEIKENIKNLFIIEKEIDEGIDVIFICSK